MQLENGLYRQIMFYVYQTMKIPYAQALEIILQEQTNQSLVASKNKTTKALYRIDVYIRNIHI